MTRDQTRALLALAAACDNRGWTPTSIDVDAWQLLLDDIDPDDAQAALVAHHKTHHYRPAPADIRTRARLTRRERLAALEKYPPAADPDDPAAYIAALRAGHVLTSTGPRALPPLDQVFRSVPEVST